MTSPPSAVSCIPRSCCRRPRPKHGLTANNSKTPSRRSRSPSPANCGSASTVRDGANPTSTGRLKTQWAGDWSKRSADGTEGFAVLLHRVAHQLDDVWRGKGWKTKLLPAVVRATGSKSSNRTLVERFGTASRLPPSERWSILKHLTSNNDCKAGLLLQHPGQSLDVRYGPSRWYQAIRSKIEEFQMRLRNIVRIQAVSRFCLAKLLLISHFVRLLAIPECPTSEIDSLPISVSKLECPIHADVIARNSHTIKRSTLDVLRSDAAPLIAFIATKETNYGTEMDGRIPG